MNDLKQNKDNETIVRFAPSPTGHLHIGGVRTALFNYLYSKNLGGRFVLRIEDTDLVRSSNEMAEDIIKGLFWLGIHWDSGPFYQSDRFDLYRETAFKLLEEKKAYRCFCSPEEIESRRKKSESKGKEEQIYKYDRTCLHLTEEEIQKKLEQNTPFIIRFLIPPGNTYFKDRIHKEMKVDNNELEDFAILKSDNSPTYHLSCVVDDSDMEITDVIRGDDHISNTYKQVLLFQALGKKPPKFAHLPLILGPDKKKLSKRHGETSLLEFKKKGYLPEAIINYLSQLSWIPADTKKIFTLEELTRQFSLSKLSKSSPVFDYDKLKFLNSRAIQEAKPRTILDILNENPEFEKKFSAFSREKKEALIELVKPRMKTIEDFEQKFELYLAHDLNYDNSDLEKLKTMFSVEDLISYLRIICKSLESIDPSRFDKTTVENEIRVNAESNGLKAADLIHPARFALTSETVSPSLFDMFEFLGKEESVRRIGALEVFMRSI